MSFIPLLNAVITLALMLAVGFVGGKLKYIDEVSTERLSTLIVKIGQPFLIVNSLISLEYTKENLKTGFLILALGICMHTALSIIASFLSRFVKGFDERKISEYCMVFANCGFVGFPIVYAIFGDRGLFYGGFFIISFHLFVWTRGIMILARGRDDIKLTWKKIFINSGTVPCTIGILLFLCNIPFPDFVYDLTGGISNLCTPISLMVSGANIARRDLKKLFSNRTIYFTLSVKLIIMPLVLTTALWLLGLPDYMIVFGGIMASMPCAAVVTMFGEMYRITPGYAAELVGTSTILCMATIFPMVTFAQFLAAHPIPW